MRIAQISDLHLVGDVGGAVLGVDPLRSLGPVLEAVKAAQPDVVIATGDLAEHGEVRAYERLRKMLESLDAPAYAIPGNHDDASHLHATLAEEGRQYPAVVEAGRWQIVLLNTRVAGKSFGLADDITALKQALASDDRPALVATHHSPVAPCAHFGCQMLNGMELLNCLTAHPRVKALLVGHTHNDRITTYGGLPIIECPSTLVEVYHPHGRESADLDDFFAAHTLNHARVGFRTYELKDDGTLDAEVHWLPNAGALQ